MTGVAVLLAAGGGTRFTGASHKLLADLDGRPVWHWSLEHLRNAGFAHIIVVTGAVDLADRPLDDPRIECVHNPSWAEGQASSVHTGIAAARRHTSAAVTIGLADQPFISTEAWRAVADAPADCRIVVAQYAGRPGPHPVRLSSEVWPLLPTTGDAGARELLRDHPEWVCTVDCIGSMVDIDTVEDLEQWRSR